MDRINVLLEVLNAYRSIETKAILCCNKSLTSIEFRANMSEHGNNSLARITRCIEDNNGTIDVRVTKRSKKANARNLRFNLNINTEKTDSLITSLQQSLNEEEIEIYNYYKKEN